MPQDDIRNLDELKRVLAERPALLRLSCDRHRRRLGRGARRRGRADAGLGEPVARHRRARAAPRALGRRQTTLLILVGTDDEFDAASRRCAIADELAVVTLPLARARLLRDHEELPRPVALRARDAERGRTAERYRYELGELIVDRARHLVGARHRQAARAHPREARATSPAPTPARSTSSRGRRSNPRERTLRFMVSQNDSVDIDFREFTLPVDDKSIVGRAVHLAPADQHPRSYSSTAAARTRGASITTQLRSQHRAIRRARC